MSGIYCILCLANGKFYIGSSIDFRKRIIKHKWELRHRRHRNLKLQRAFTKYGESQFVFALLEIVDEREELLKLEQMAIDQLKAVSRGFNIATNAQHSALGSRHSGKTLRVMSEGKRGALNPMFGVSLFGSQNGMFGKSKSQETRARHSATVTGAGNHMFGKRHTSEAKQRQSLAKKGRPSYKRTPEMNAKMSVALKGRIMLPEWIAKSRATKRAKRELSNLT